MLGILCISRAYTSVTLVLRVYLGETWCSGPLSSIYIQATMLLHYGIPFEQGTGFAR
jgi:hypothetical protein